MISRSCSSKIPTPFPPNETNSRRCTRKSRQSRAATEPARAQRNAFLRLCFAGELLHYYQNQTTESPDVVFAQRLPPLVEQLVITGEHDTLDEKLVKQAEDLLAFIIKPDHRHAVINNMGKAGGLARTLRFVLTFRAVKLHRNGSGDAGLAQAHDFRRKSSQDRGPFAHPAPDSAGHANCHRPRHRSSRNVCAGKTPRTSARPSPGNSA